MNEASAGEKLTTRADVIVKIEARLAGTLSTKALAGWAFDRFYAEELGNETYEPEAEQAIADALDALMFSDDADFGLEPDALQQLIGQLR